jgi:hypothetical protein
MYRATSEAGIPAASAPRGERVPEVVRATLPRSPSCLERGFPFTLPPVAEVDVGAAGSGEDEPGVETPGHELQRGGRASREGDPAT